MYPRVSLKIQNHVPAIIYYPVEGEARKMTTQDENILELFSQMAKELSLIEKDKEITPELFDELLEIARNADEEYVDPITEFDEDSSEFDLENYIMPELKKQVEQSKSEYQNVEMADEIRAELERNRNADIFASMLENIYANMILKTLLSAAEIGVDKIQIEDSHGNSRLYEKMARELDNLGIDLIVTGKEGEGEEQQE